MKVYIELSGGCVTGVHDDNLNLLTEGEDYEVQDYDDGDLCYYCGEYIKLDKAVTVDMPDVESRAFHPECFDKWLITHGEISAEDLDKLP